MKRVPRHSERVSSLLFCLVFATAWGGARGQSLTDAKPAALAPGKKRVSVADCIQMVTLADPYYAVGGSSRGLVAEFSPDGTRFVVTVKKGNLQNNTNEYSVLLWNTGEVYRSPKAKLLLTLASSSNRPAIQQLAWIDSHRLSFLGERPGQLQQLYLFDLTTSRLQRLTRHPTSLLSYGWSAGGSRIAFAAVKPRGSLINDNARRRGIRVSSQSLSDLIAGYIPPRDQEADSELFDMKIGDTRVVRVETRWKFLHTDYHNELAISPNGRYMIVPTEAPSIPDSWSAYEDPFFRAAVRRRVTGSSTGIFRYTLFDLDNGISQTLLDAPIGLGFGGSEVFWAPDSRSVVVAGVWLPLDVADPEEKESRQSKKYVAEIKIPSRTIVEITTEDLRLVQWDSGTDLLKFERGRINSITGRNPAPEVYYRRKGDGWERAEPPRAAGGGLAVALEEGLHTPPRIVVVSRKSNQKSLLLDLNPGFSDLSLGRVEEVKWKASDGHEVNGGLYFPPDYIKGAKYPLVIQTHGFNATRFWIDGPYDSTAFAAQPLASRGFLVLQADESFEGIGTPVEVLRETSAIEGAIDHLEQLDLIDRTRVGLIGFSRTGLFVKYALTHSSYRFGAASVADGTEADYFPYIAFYNSWGGVAEMETLNVDPPFGRGLLSWLERSPGFNLNNVQTPFLAQALGPNSLLLGWEWFIGLSRLGKPVEMIYLPDASHLIVKPWERQTSLELNVDWFCFWLKGEEDSDPAKAEQYARWSKLRELQGSSARADESSR